MVIPVSCGNSFRERRAAVCFNSVSPQASAVIQSLDGDRRHHIDSHRAVISEARAVIEEYEILEAEEGPEPEGPAALAAFVQMREKLMRERQKVSADEALP
jgi:hypothetical protein